MILGYLLAVAAAIGSGTGSILESIGIRRAGVAGGRSESLLELRRQPIYFLGLSVDLLGFLCAASALQRLPLFLVQSTLALSIAVTATISYFLGNRLERAGWLAIGGGATGLVLLGISAQPGPSEAVPTGWHWLMLLMVVPTAVVAWFGKRLRGAHRAPVLALAAAVNFSVVGIAARSLQVPDPWWQLIAEPAVAALAVNGLAGVVIFAMALQQGSAVTVSAIMFTTTTTLPSIIGLFYLGDRLRSGFEPIAAAGFVLAVCGAIATAHYSARATHPPAN